MKISDFKVNDKVYSEHHKCYGIVRVVETYRIIVEFDTYQEHLHPALWNCCGAIPSGNGRFFCNKRCNEQTRCESIYCLSVVGRHSMYDTLYEILHV